MKQVVIPAILDESVEGVRRKVEMVQGLVGRVQIDIIDGVYADNLTVAPSDLSEIDFGDLSVDFHLMTEEPVDYVMDCLELRDCVSSIRMIGQVERMSNQENFVDEVRKSQFDVGLALDLYTPLSSLEKSLFSRLDCILLMSVKAGFSGQAFSRSITRKISKLRQRGYTGEIMMDGGMDPKTIPIALRAGATSFGVTSYLWKGNHVKRHLKELMEAL